MTAVSSSTSFPTPLASSADGVTNGANPNSGTAGGVITDNKTFQQTYSQFLTLLTAQLQHQDPTSPMDTAQFTSQLVSFSEVEQQLKTNADLDKLVAQQNNNQASLGLSYIGLNVSVEGDKFDFDPAKYTSITLSYDLSATPATNKINILDQNGNTVYSTNGQLTAGKNTFTWDGKDNSGNFVPGGTYSIQVAAMDATKTPVSVTTEVPGQVIGMQTQSDGTVELQVGSQLVPLTSITSAYLPAKASSSASGG
jgi:flagellar basal-body rod modification protein FlgD